MAGDLTRPRSLVVEFVGLPGVGKSHAARLVAARLAARGTPTRSLALRVNHDFGRWRRVLYKLSLCAAEAARDPGSVSRVGRALVRSQQGRLDVVRLAYNWLFLLGLLRRARRRPVVELLDEGVVQILWSIGYAGAEHAVRDSVRLLFGRARGPIPDVVVVVEAPLPLIEARLAARRSRAGRIDRLDATARSAGLARGATVLAQVLSDDVGLVGGGSGSVVRRLRNGDADELDADVNALVTDLAALAAGAPTTRGQTYGSEAGVAPSSNRS